MNKPKGFEDYLGNYGEQYFDSYCGEPVGWGFPIIKHLGEQKWQELSRFGDLECSYPNWYLITKKLTYKEAIKKYGKVTKLVVGPRGGFRKIVFGQKIFLSKNVRPSFEEEELISETLKEIEN